MSLRYKTSNKVVIKPRNVTATPGRLTIRKRNLNESPTQSLSARPNSVKPQGRLTIKQKHNENIKVNPTLNTYIADNKILKVNPTLNTYIADNKIFKTSINNANSTGNENFYYKVHEKMNEQYYEFENIRNINLEQELKYIPLLNIKGIVDFITYNNVQEIYINNQEYLNRQIIKQFNTEMIKMCYDLELWFCQIIEPKPKILVDEWKLNEKNKLYNMFVKNNNKNYGYIISPHCSPDIIKHIEFGLKYDDVKEYIMNHERNITIAKYIVLQHNNLNIY